MNKLKLVWENNPDTPITASNLSKTISTLNDDQIIFKDYEGLINNPDNLVKIKANSRFVINNTITTALFNFYDSLVSHNSQESALIAENISYRIETPLDIGKSIALETQTENKVINGDFSNDLNNWNIETENNGSVTISELSLYGDKCVKFETLDSLSKSKISQIIQFEQTTVDSDNQNISISFYYKSEDELKFLIVGKPNSTQPIYWNNDESSLRWEVQASAAEISLTPSDTWKRVEIKNIRTNSIWPDNNIRLDIYTSIKNKCYIDGIQVEEKAYCSSFTPNIRGNSVLTYPSSIVRTKQGLIDIEFLLKYLNTEKNVLLQIKMNPQLNTTTNITYNDALRIEFDVINKSFKVIIYDVLTQSEQTISKSLSEDDFNNLLNNWQRLIVVWENNNFIKFTVNGDTIINNTSTFQMIDKLELTNIEVGGDNTGIFEGLISSLKFNLFYKNDDEIIIDSMNPPYADNNINKIFEVDNENITIDKSMLDIDEIFYPSTEYFIYIVDEENIQEEVNIVISKDGITPYSISKYFSYLIGGFKLDNNREVIVDSVWDIKSKSFKTIMTERFLIHGKDSEANNIEFRSYPYGLGNDAKFNVPTYYTNHLYGVSAGQNFFDIDPAGLVKIDNIQIDNNIIQSINNNNLKIYSNNYNVEITGNNIDINALNGDIQLDNIRVKGNQFRSIVNSDLILSNDTTTDTSKVIINSYIGTSQIIGATCSIESNNINILGQNVVIEPLMGVQINSTAHPIYLDNLSVSGNDLSAKDGGDLHLKSPTQIQVDSSMRINDDVLLFSNDNGQKILLDDTPENGGGYCGFGMQVSSLYHRTNNHFTWYRQGSHSDIVGDPGPGGTVLALLTGNDQTMEDLGITEFDEYSNFYAGRVHNAIWNDYAECWPKDGKVEYGQVVYRTEKGVMPTIKRAQKATIGVVSDTYGHLLGDKGFNKDLNKSKVIPIGLMGRVKVKYIKKLSIGDLVVSYKNGQVIKANWFEKIFLSDRIVGMVDSLIDDKICWIKIK